MNRCTSVQERLADEGVALIGRDAEIAEHVVGCSSCGAFLEALKQVDAGMSRLPRKPAPPSLLVRTARAVAGNPKPCAGRRVTDPGARRLAASLAAMVVLAAGFGLVESMQRELAQAQQALARQFSGGFMAQDFEDGDRTVLSSVQAKAPAKLRAQSAPATPRPMAAPIEQMLESEPPLDSASMPGSTVTRELEELPALLTAPSRPTSGDGYASLDKSLIGLYSERQQPYEDNRRDRKNAGKANKEKRSENQPAVPAQVGAEMAAIERSKADERDDDVRRGRLAMLAEPGRVTGAKDKLEKKLRAGAGGTLADAAEPRQAAKRFLAEREALTGLRFQSGTGYWTNTYVPGDPAIRLLEARLQRWDRSALDASLGDARLEATVRRNWQPFDVPRNAALAAYLHADKRAVNGRSRLRIQVGLQASQKRSGLRPDMNVGVVLDLRRPVDDATGAKLRALVMALTEARQPGDRFSITVAGDPGGLLVAPEKFRYGPIRVAMQSLLTTTSDAQAPAMDLLAAVHGASQRVRQDDDASAPLGASLVLLVSTAPFAEQRESLERMAHENAVAGIGLSVVAVGGGPDLASIDRLVLLGQGRRRVLAATEDATQLVDRELHAASRAVARAVRLRIRLAPGVELIDVLGSKNLTEQAAQRVREAERSIDRRLARNIGIRTDRGDDEEGIQIVIPSFFAGDNHVVLLDVVVPGAGPVADVSVRYKDLVYRRNGVARARLAIEDGRRDPGPLERNVLKNQLAHELARSAATAGRRLAAGDRQDAVRTLTAARDLIAGMRLETPGWDNDNELREDQALLTQYLTALGSSFASAGPNQQHLANSLRYLAFRRLIPPLK